MSAMAMHSRMLTSGPGWSVYDNVCTAGPRDRPFEEQHRAVCIAAVTHGTFRYRSRQGTALLAPGALLLGNHGHCFECGHEHGAGDRCLSFHFSPGHWEEVIAAIPGVRRATFARPHLPARPAMIPLIAAFEAAAGDLDQAVRRTASLRLPTAEAEELALRFAGAVTASLAGTGGPGSEPSRRDRQRIADAVRRIEAGADDPSHQRLSLAALACEAAMSPYHFLRTFRRVIGMTPHQYTLRTRLHRAAVRLRQSGEPVSTIAYDAGFNDLSTFNRRFRRLMGESPTVYRGRRRSHA
jgi:AraC family transcriptional regulator